MNTSSRARTVQRTIPATETSDGAGVKLRRSIGATPALRFDPFLMLDEFGTENPEDYIAGFPPHPHRGFETVTYMIDGHMRHEDHLGNVGELRSGGVQWMTAGRGVIHSEMPQQERGRMRGFQLWINLPAREKMRAAAYRDIAASELPEIDLAGGGKIKMIAGRCTIDGRQLSGPVNGTTGDMATDPFFADLGLTPGSSRDIPLPAGHNAFIYVYEGDVLIGGEKLGHHRAGLLGAGDHVGMTAGPYGAQAIVVAGKPLAEPVEQYGPFVMNTREEIEQALEDYRSGRLTG